MQIILIVDGSNLAHRCRHVFHLSYQNIDVSVTYGFIRTLWSTMQKYDPMVVIVCWDGGAPQYRYDRCPTYKRRDHTDDPDYPVFLDQVMELQDVLPILGVLSVRRKQIEADDLMYHAAAMLDGKKVIMTTDQDLYQAVVNDYAGNIVVYSPTKELEITRDNFEKEVGVKPTEFLVYRSLVGDSSDNIPGCKGIGPKTAMELLVAYKSSPTAMVNTARGIGDPAAPKMSKSVAEKLIAFGHQGFSDMFVTMRLDRDMCGARRALLEAFDAWEVYQHSEVVGFLKQYAFASLIDVDFYRSFKGLRDPSEFLKDVSSIRMPSVPPTRVSSEVTQ